jgi:hypothetical protein
VYLLSNLRTYFPAYAPAFWLCNLLSDLRTCFLALQLLSDLLSGPRTYFLACAPTSGLAPTFWLCNCFLAYAPAFWLCNCFLAYLLAYAPDSWLCNCFLAYLLACTIELAMRLRLLSSQFCSRLPEISGCGATPPNCLLQHIKTYLPNGISGRK